MKDVNYYFDREFQSTDLDLLKDALAYKNETLEEFIVPPDDMYLKEDFLEDYNYKKWLNKYENKFQQWKEDVINNHYPMWNTIWKCDEFYLNSEYCDYNKLWRLGIGIISHPERGNFLFINGAGYDFYETHWKPLFKMLKWID